MIRDRAFFEKNGFTLEAEATPKCNFGCPYCENRDDGTDPGPDLDLSELLAFAERSFPVGKLTVLLNGGEPTLNPGLEEFCVRAAARQNMSRAVQAFSYSVPILRFYRAKPAEP